MSDSVCGSSWVQLTTVMIFEQTQINRQQKARELDLLQDQEAWSGLEGFLNGTWVLVSLAELFPVWLYIPGKSKTNIAELYTTLSNKKFYFGLPTLQVQFQFRSASLSVKFKSSIKSSLFRQGTPSAIGYIVSKKALCKIRTTWSCSNRPYSILITTF